LSSETPARDVWRRIQGLLAFGSIARPASQPCLADSGRSQQRRAAGPGQSALATVRCVSLCFRGVFRGSIQNRSGNKLTLGKRHRLRPQLPRRTRRLCCLQPAARSGGRKREKSSDCACRSARANSWAMQTLPSNSRKIQSNRSILSS